MPRQILNPIIGGNVPTGPSSVRGAGTSVDGGWARRKETGRAQPKNHKSKKAYTGTLAGVGRGTIGGVPVVYRSGPRGPQAFGGATQLPRRGSVSSGAVSFTPAPRPSLMTRVGRGLRRSAAAMGFQF